MTFCQAGSRRTLDLMQYSVAAKADAAKAQWSARRLERAQRKAAWHLATCVPCLLRSLPSSQVSVPQ